MTKSPRITQAHSVIAARCIDINLNPWRWLSAEDREDMRAAAWVTILERYPRYVEARAHYRTYANACVVSAFADWYRANHRPRYSTPETVAQYNEHIRRTFGDVVFAAAPDSPKEIQAHADTTIEEALDNQAALLSLHAALDTLPTRDRELTTLFLSGLPQNEIARRFGVSDSRISQMLTAIKDKLREVILNERHQGDEGPETSQGPLLASRDQE